MRSRFLLIAAICFIPWAADAQDLGPVEQADPDHPSVQQWMERLESKRYSVRNEAMAELQRRGLSVIDELEQITLQGTTESADRAFEILKRHHTSGDPTLRDAATTKLERIAATSGHPRAKAARDVLDPPNPASSHNNGGVRLPNLLLPGNLQIQLRNGAAAQNQIIGNAQMRVRVKVTNGKRDVTVEENGTKLRVVEDDKGIRVERTDRNGQTKTKQYTDREQLKKDDPEALKSFDHSGGGVQIQIGAQAAGGRIQPPPALPGNPNADDVRKRIEQIRAEHLRRHEEMLEQHQEMLKRLREQRQRPGQRPAEVPSVPPGPKESKIELIEV